MTFRKFEDIEVWKMGRELVKAVYGLTRGIAFARDYGFKDQIQRAALSVPSNVAEGYARRGNKEFLKFLWYSKGSAAEVQSQLFSAMDLGYVSQTDAQKVYDLAERISVKLYHLIQSLSSESTRTKTIPSSPVRPVSP